MLKERMDKLRLWMKRRMDTPRRWWRGAQPDWIRERGLESLLERVKREFEDERRAAAGDRDKLVEISSRESDEIEMCHEDLDELRTNRLLRKAGRLRIDPPPKPSNIQHSDEFWGNDAWDRGRIQYGLSLTRQGKDDLLRLIREEEKRQREVRAFWVGVIAAPLSAAAALISTLAAIATLVWQK